MIDRYFGARGFPSAAGIARVWEWGGWVVPPGWLPIGSELATFAAIVLAPIALVCSLARFRGVPVPPLVNLPRSGVGLALKSRNSWKPARRLAVVLRGISATLSRAGVIATGGALAAAPRPGDIARSEDPLRDGGGRFALAALGTDHEIWDWDVATGATYYSPRFLGLLDHDGPEFGDGVDAWESRLHPEDRDRVMAAVAAHLDRRAPYIVEYRLLARDGVYRWFHARGQAVCGADGRPIRMIGSIDDITERKHQEAVIAEQVRLAEFSRDIALVLGEDSTLPEMLRRCVEVTVGRLDGAFSRIWTVDEAGSVLELQASAGIYTHIDGPLARIPVGCHKIGRIALERRPHLTNSVQGDPMVPEQEWAARRGMVAFAGYPLVVGDRLIGVWAMFAAHPLSGSTLAAMESVAHGIALGIERKRSASALLQSEAEARKLALVAARTDNAVILTDPDGRIEWVNDGFIRITGYELAEAIGRTPGSLLQGPRTDPEAARYMRERQQRGEGFRTEILNYSKSGREYWISVEVQPVHDGDGRLVQFMAIEADITERKRAEEALRRSEERFALAALGADEGLWDWDVRTDAVYYSARFAGFLGREGGEFEGTLEDWKSRLHPEDLDRVLSALASHFERRTPYDAEYRLRVADGDYRWFHARGQAVWDEGGRAVRMAGTIGDITDRKRIELQLRLLQAAVENANDVILITEAEPIDQLGPRVVYVNQAFERATGYSAAEILGKTPRILQGPGTNRETLDQLRKKLTRWRPARVELLNYAKDGREFWGELNIRPVADATGFFTHWVSVQRDITERKLADLERRARNEGEVRDLNSRLEQRVLRLDALRQIDLAISGSLDLRLTLGIVLDQVLAQLRVDAAVLLLFGSHDQVLSHAASKGFRTDGITATRLRPGEGYAGRAVLEDSPIKVPDLSRAESPFLRSELLVGEGFAAYYAIPLVAKGIARGVLEVYHRSPLELDRDAMAFFEALAGQAAIAVDNATLFRDLQRSHAGLVAAYDATIEGWARALDLRDKETEGHTRRVTEKTVDLARSMGVDESEILAIRRGALLHDIGKLGIPDSILLKPGKLTEEEWQVMRRHPEYAFEWLAPIATLRPALDIPYCHHEKWDGTGYPRGLAGEQIPLAARMFAVVDIWDALRSDRPYREGWAEWRVLEHIRSLAGTHLDPAAVEAFLLLTGMGDGPEPPTASSGAGKGGVGHEDRAADLEASLSRAAESVRLLEVQRDEQSLEIARLSLLSLTDDLTGLYNRRHHREALESAFSLACRQDLPLSVVLLDVDHFKSYNDDHGHQAGDVVLRALAGILRSEVRPHDLIARHGGEEFVVLLPGTDADAARIVAERLRSAIAGHDWPLRRVTASFGIATTPPGLLSAADLIDAADVALYLSKQLGRDRVTHREEMGGLMPDDQPLVAM